MKLSDKIKLLFLAFLGNTRIIDLKRLILENKLKLSPEMAYEFSVDGLGTILTNVVKRIVEIMPSKAEGIISGGARDAGRDFALLLKGRGLIDKRDKRGGDIDKAILLLMMSLRMKYVQKRLTRNESVYHIIKCPFLKILSKEGVPEICCMLCRGWFQGIADVTAKDSTVKISKKISGKNDYCEFVIRKKEISGKELPFDGKLKISINMAHEFAVRELGRLCMKMGKRVMRNTTPETYKTILFWGARDAGREVGKMIKRFGIKDGLNAVEAGTVFFATSSRMKRAQIKISENENIGHVFVCPWAAIAIKDKIPEACMLCEGFCQGVADVMAKGSIAEIPKKMTKGDEYCKFVYKKVK